MKLDKTFVDLVDGCSEKNRIWMRAFFKAGPGHNTQIRNPVYKFSYRDNTPKLGDDDDLVLQNDGHGCYAEPGGLFVVATKG